jgi:hypothetical protein
MRYVGIQSRTLLIVILSSPLVTPVHCQQMSRSVVLSARAARDLVENGTRQISKKDVASLEIALPQVSSLTAEGWSSAVHIDNPQKYFRQYVAVIREAKKQIYVNAFCDEHFNADWRERLVIVDDGATCYWQALFDPALHRFSDLRINSRG